MKLKKTLKERQIEALKKENNGWIKLNGVAGEMEDCDCWVLDSSGNIFFSEQGQFIPIGLYKYYMPISKPTILPERYNFQIKNNMSKENKPSDKQQNGNDFIADVKTRLFSYKDMYEAVKYAIWNEENYINKNGMINIDDIISDAIKYAVNLPEQT